MTDFAKEDLKIIAARMGLDGENLPAPWTADLVLQANALRLHCLEIGPPLEDGRPEEILATLRNAGVDGYWIQKWVVDPPIHTRDFVAEWEDKVQKKRTRMMRARLAIPQGEPVQVVCAMAYGESCKGCHGKGQVEEYSQYMDGFEVNCSTCHGVGKLDARIQVGVTTAVAAFLFEFRGMRKATENGVFENAPVTAAGPLTGDDAPTFGEVLSALPPLMAYEIAVELETIRVHQWRKAPD